LFQCLHKLIIAFCRLIAHLIVHPAKNWV
jgi:hypothetical protein